MLPLYKNKIILNGRNRVFFYAGFSCITTGKSNPGRKHFSIILMGSWGGGGDVVQAVHFYSMPALTLKLISMTQDVIWQSLHFCSQNDT